MITSGFRLTGIERKVSEGITYAFITANIFDRNNDLTLVRRWGEIPINEDDRDLNAVIHSGGHWRLGLNDEIIVI